MPPDFSLQHVWTHITSLSLPRPPPPPPPPHPTLAIALTKAELPLGTKNPTEKHLVTAKGSSRGLREALILRLYS